MTAISEESALRELLGEPAEVVRAKVSDRLNAERAERYAHREGFY